MNTNNRKIQAVEAPKRGSDQRQEAPRAYHNDDDDDHDKEDDDLGLRVPPDREWIYWEGVHARAVHVCHVLGLSRSIILEAMFSGSLKPTELDSAPPISLATISDVIRRAHSDEGHDA
tara:strand:- start:46 stop:399 length:354 start_codon:yes stop_codon:yes gene_type:complete